MATIMMSGAALAGDEAVFLIGELALRTRPNLNDRLDAVVNPDPLVIGKQSEKSVERADGIVLLRDGNRIYLASSNTRSHYYAAGRLLNLWGCRWYMPTEFGECIPERPTLPLSVLDEAYAPPLEILKYWLSWNASAQGYNGENDSTLRVHNTHHNGGLFRRPFLYRPAAERE